jgi:hypothetical protein
MTSLRSQQSHRPPHPQHPTEAAMKNEKFVSSLTSTRAARMATLTYVTVVLLQLALAILLLHSAAETFEHDMAPIAAPTGAPAGVCSPAENPVPGDARCPIVGVPPPLTNAHGGEEVTAWA